MLGISGQAWKHLTLNQKKEGQYLYSRLIIMILGSHNSWSYLPIKNWWMRPFSFIAKCQNIDIQTQYEKCNVRCFDLRVKFDKNGRLIIAHGLIKYKYTKGNLIDDLVWLNRRGDCYVRIIHEVRNEKEYTPESIENFKRLCGDLEGMFLNIKFWCGRNLYNWEKDFYFDIEPTCLELYSSVIPPKIPYPKGYAKTHNRTNILLANQTNKEILLIDFVNIK